MPADGFCSFCLCFYLRLESTYIVFPLLYLFLCSSTVFFPSFLSIFCFSTTTTLLLAPSPLTNFLLLHSPFYTRETYYNSSFLDLFLQGEKQLLAWPKYLDFLWLCSHLAKAPHEDEPDKLGIDPKKLGTSPARRRAKFLSNTFGNNALWIYGHFLFFRLVLSMHQ